MTKMSQVTTPYKKRFYLPAQQWCHALYPSIMSHSIASCSGEIKWKLLQQKSRSTSKSKITIDAELTMPRSPTCPWSRLLALPRARIQVLINDTATGNKYCFFVNGSSYKNRLANDNGSGNYYDGLIVNGSSYDNNFTNDIANSNVKRGFIDVTTGSGTAGTDNNYTSDVCKAEGTSSSPLGLCSTSGGSLQGSPIQQQRSQASARPKIIAGRNNVEPYLPSSDQYAASTYYRKVSALMILALVWNKSKEENHVYFLSFRECFPPHL